MPTSTLNLGDCLTCYRLFYCFYSLVVFLFWNSRRNNWNWYIHCVHWFAQRITILRPCVCVFMLVLRGKQNATKLSFRPTRNEQKTIGEMKCVSNAFASLTFLTLFLLFAHVINDWYEWLFSKSAIEKLFLSSYKLFYEISMCYFSLSSFFCLMNMKFFYTMKNDAIYFLQN